MRRIRSYKGFGNVKFSTKAAQQWKMSDTSDTGNPFSVSLLLQANTISLLDETGLLSRGCQGTNWYWEISTGRSAASSRSSCLYARKAVSLQRLSSTIMGPASFPATGV